MMEIKTVLCPVDFSPPSRVAFEYAQEFANRFRAKLVLLHVNPVPQVYATGYAGFIPLPPYDKQPDSRLETWKDEASNKGVNVDAMHLVGIPEHSIVSFAKQSGADLIVLGTHGYHGFMKFMLGSVADYVMRHAPCDVLVARDGRADRPELSSMAASATA